MARRPTYLDMIRAAPAEHAVLVAVPILLAIAQLVNSLVTGLSPVVAGSFAVVLLGYTGLVWQYNLARFRRNSLERELQAV